MNTPDAMIVSQIPIAIALFILAYELRLLRKTLQKIAEGPK